MNAALGIGKPVITIKALRDTYFKRSPVDSSQQLPMDLRSLEKDYQVEILAYRLEGNHYKIVSGDLRILGDWYVFAPHAQILINGKPLTLLLTKEQLYQIALYTPIEKLDALLKPLNDAMAEYQITTPLRIAHFIAQVAHESDGFNTTVEYASGDAYEWREDLGNTQAGDGRRYLGRGLVQVTGRFNYKDCGDALGVDLISNPELLAKPELACRSAGWFWHTRELNAYADRDDPYKITRIINGSTNGLEDRLSYLSRAKQVLGV